VRVIIAISLSVLLASCSEMFVSEYLRAGIKLAQNPVELAEEYYEKVRADKLRLRRQKNLEALKAEFDLQECGAVYFWLSEYYRRHNEGKSFDADVMTRKYTITGIDRMFLGRVIQTRMGDGMAVLPLGKTPDVNWLMHNKRLCDEVYSDRVTQNPKFGALFDQSDF
jgi:hypothetical protein